jgi:hypothetical protein
LAEVEHLEMEALAGRGSFWTLVVASPKLLIFMMFS